MSKEQDRSSRPKSVRCAPCWTGSKIGMTWTLDGSSPPLIDCFAINCRARDAAYGPGPMLGWLVDRKIKPHIPVLDKSLRTDGTWSRTDFEWDPENNQYIYPEGEALKQFRRNYSDPNRGPNGKGVAKYRGLKLTCQACPSKAKCCPTPTSDQSPAKSTKMPVRSPAISRRPNNM